MIRPSIAQRQTALTLHTHLFRMLPAILLGGAAAGGALSAGGCGGSTTPAGARDEGPSSRASSGDSDAAASSASSANSTFSLDPRDNARVFFIGHSLVNHDMPRMVSQVAQDAGHTHDYAVQVINGGPLRLAWDDSATAEGTDSRANLPSGNYDTVILTEAIPLADQIEWNDTYGFASRFYQLAISSNAATQVYLYETWHGLTDPNWRARIRTDLSAWEGIIDHVNANNEGPPMRLIPAGQALGALVDRVEAGGVPGLTARRDLFDDDPMNDIHMNDIGNYFIALVHYAAIYRRSPIGRTFRMNGEEGHVYQMPSEAMARVMQEVAWEAVNAYSR